MPGTRKHLCVMGLALAGLSLVISAGVALWPAGIRAQSPNRVGLVIGLGDGSVLTRCVAFDEGQINGLDLLLQAGLDVIYEVAGGAGTTVCSIEGDGCDYPAEDCFCECPGGPNCIYWSYWHLKDGAWQYSPVGAAAYPVGDGDVEGWAWGVELPEVAFTDICAPPPTATATSTPIATFTSTPTDTPEPTRTPGPPTISYFKADRAAINAGESATLSWDLSDAEVAYLRYEGTEEGVVAPGSKAVSPAKTTTYTLVARNAGGETQLQLSVAVTSVTNTPEATSTSPVTSESAATDTPLPSATPTLTDPPSTPVSTKGVTALPTDTPLPSPAVEANNTPLPSPTPSPGTTLWATSTPAPVAVLTLAFDIEPGATPLALVRDTSQRPESGFPVYVLGIVGVVALLGGAVGIVVILLVVQREVR
jgi:hypothetical protein